MLHNFSLQPKASKTTLNSPNHLQPNQPKMSSNTEEFIQRHFNTLQKEETEFTSNQSETYSQLLGQLEDKEAREIKEALRISAQEAMERQKKKAKSAHKAP